MWFDPDVLMINVVIRKHRIAQKEILQLIFLLVTEDYTTLLIRLFLGENGHKIND